MPAALTRRTDDSFLNEFLAARQRAPDLSPEEFVAPFDFVADSLCEQLGVEIVEETEETMLAMGDTSKAEFVFNEEAEGVRGRAKSRGVLDHDLAHFALVTRDRRTHVKTWFLTQDGVLLRSAPRLAESGYPFCFSLAGLLQSLSPFIDVRKTNSFVETFSTLVSDQALPMEQVYDTRELLVLSDLHDDGNRPSNRVLT